MKSLYPFSSDHKLHSIFVLLLFTLAWVATHPYEGIWHDGTLYLAQALLKINPSIYQHDVFFKFGSQDSYSIFSILYAFFINLMGIETAALVLVVISQIFFIFALWLLITEIYGRAIRAWSICGLAILSAYYGSYSIFSYAENFFTARSIAEPLCLLAIYYLLRQRPWLSAGILLLAGLFHPLIALPALFIWWIFLSLSNKKYWYFILFLPIIFLLAIINVQPFHKILETYDSAWWDIIFIRNKNVLPLEWPLVSWVLLGVDFCCIYLATRVLQGHARRLMIATLFATISFTILAALGTSILQNVLLTSLQLWRVGWLLHFFAMTAVPYFIIILWRKGGLAIYSAVFLAFSGFLYPDLPFLSFIAFSVVLYILHRRGMAYDGVNQRLRIYLNFGVGITFLAFLIKASVDLYALTSIPAIFETTQMKKIEITFFSPYIWKLELVIAWGLFFIFNQKKSAIAFLLICLLPLGYLWDQRSVWQKYLTSEQAANHPFQKYITEHHEAYWHINNAMNSWILLGSTSYYSKIQGAGALFNRGTAIELNNRAKLLRQDKSNCLSPHYTTEGVYGTCEPDQAMVQKICSKEQHLDVMIFPFEIKGLQAISWTFKQPDGTQNSTFYLYPCSAFRKP